MKKVLVLSFIGALLIGCTKIGKTDYAILSGKIIEPNSQKLHIINDSGEAVKEIVVKEDGSFADTIFNVNGYYTLYDEIKNTILYLENSYDLNLMVDTKKFDETLTYTGKGAEPNNYMARKMVENGKVFANYMELFELDESQFVEKITTLYADLDKRLPGLPKKFIESERENLLYDKASNLARYEGFHGYLKGDKTFKVSANFPDPYKGIRLDNDEKYKNSQSYRKFIQDIFGTEIISTAQNPNNNVSSPMKAASDKLNEMKPGAIREGIAKYLAEAINSGDADSEVLYASIMESTSDGAFKEELTKKMKRLRTLMPGADSPVFVNYENYNGGTTSLIDLKGKFVYIDIWATWCGPCIEETPAFKELVKKYNGKNVTFVSISIDTAADKEKWRNTVREKEMNWVQLFAENERNSTFIRDYDISDIPRFIFLDPDGKIVSVDAPRPSQKEEIDYLFSQSGVK